MDYDIVNYIIISLFSRTHIKSYAQELLFLVFY